ncbi:MAG: HEPN domain-containing protein [Bacillota bacterium]
MKSKKTSASPGGQNHVGVDNLQIALPGPRVRAGQMNLPLSGLGTRAAKVFENWLINYEQYQPVYDLYFGTLYQSGMYITQEFLSLVQALEIYHRRFVSNEVVPNEEHVARLEKVLCAVPRNLRKWVMGCLKYSNEPRLAQRLSQVFQAQSSIFKGDNDVALAERIADTRNYLVHYDPKLEKKALSDQELLKVSARLRLALETVILGQLGFSNEDISELIRKQGKWLQTVWYLN